MTSYRESKLAPTGQEIEGAALAGEVISIQMGLSLGPALAPTPDVQISGVGQLENLLAGLIYVSVGGHLVLLSGLADSLRTLPPGAPFDAVGGASAGVLAFGALFTTAVRTAAPVMVTLLLVSLALAVLSRAVPQLNVWLQSFPVTIGVGLLMLGGSLGVVAHVLHSEMSELPGTVDSIVALFHLTPAAR